MVNKEWGKLYLFLISVMLITVSGISQIQKGLDIEGQVLSNFGSSVSMSNDGNTIACGAPGNNLKGYVCIYSWINNAWIQKGEKIFSSAYSLSSTSNEFGRSVSISSDGNVVAIGNFRSKSDTVYPRRGSVEVYDWNGNDWKLRGDVIYGSIEMEFFGFSVSLSSDAKTLAIGIPHYWDHGIFLAGAVRIFKWDGMQWVQKGADILCERQHAGSGWTVDISSNGNEVAIGAPYTQQRNLPGFVRVYSWNENNWEQKGDEITANESFGYISLSDEGNKVAFGDVRDSTANGRSGSVSVYYWDGYFWEQLGDRIIGEADGDGFGWSISSSLDGNIIAVGAGINKGYVRLFEWNGNNWNQIGQDIYGLSENARLGRSVSISSDGRTLCAGAPNHGTDSTFLSGQVRVFEFPITNVVTYNEVDFLSIYPNPTSDNFTVSAAIAIQSVSVYTPDGRMVRKIEFTDCNLSEKQINVESLSKGIYFVLVTTVNWSGMTKLLKH